jgi:hypothetical protein
MPMAQMVEEVSITSGIGLKWGVQAVHLICPLRERVLRVYNEIGCADFTSSSLLIQDFFFLLFCTAAIFALTHSCFASAVS